MTPLMRFDIPVPCHFSVVDGDTMNISVTQKMMAQVADLSDQVVMDAVRKYAAEIGVTNLYLIDKNFLVKAFKDAGLLDGEAET